MLDETKQQSKSTPTLSYATKQRRGRPLASAAILCAFATPGVHVLAFVLRSVNLKPGFKLVEIMTLVAVFSALAGIWLSVRWLLWERKKGWGIAGLVLNSLALFVNVWPLVWH
jgi:hypothetical protein